MADRGHSQVPTERQVTTNRRSASLVLTFSSVRLFLSIISGVHLVYQMSSPEVAEVTGY
jgi:hypothetical protein